MGRRRRFTSVRSIRRAADEKHGTDCKLIRVMYTAPKRFSKDQLDKRIPLSVAQWQ